MPLPFKADIGIILVNISSSLRSWMKGRSRFLSSNLSVLLMTKMMKVSLEIDLNTTEVFFAPAQAI